MAFGATALISTVGGVGEAAGGSEAAGAAIAGMAVARWEGVIRSGGPEGARFNEGTGAAVIFETRGALDTALAEVPGDGAGSVGGAVDSVATGATSPCAAAPPSAGTGASPSLCVATIAMSTPPAAANRPAASA